MFFFGCKKGKAKKRKKHPLGVPIWTYTHVWPRFRKVKLFGLLCSGSGFGHPIFRVLGLQVRWTYAYMRKLYDRNPRLYFATISAQPSKLLPAVYTPTVGEACQKFGKMPLYSRGWVRF